MRKRERREREREKERGERERGERERHGGEGNGRVLCLSPSDEAEQKVKKRGGAAASPVPPRSGRAPQCAAPADRRTERTSVARPLSPATPVLSARQTLRWDDETEAKCSPASLTRAVGRSVGRAGLSRQRRRATEVDKEENKAAAPLLSRRACLPVTNPRKERDRPRQEREREAAS